MVGKELHDFAEGLATLCNVQLGDATKLDSRRAPQGKACLAATKKLRFTTALHESRSRCAQPDCWRRTVKR